MKFSMAILMMLFGMFSVNAQQETLFSNINHVGGFGGPMIEMSQVNGETVIDVGGGGGIILDNFFIGGYGLGTDNASFETDVETFDIDFGHGGLWMGYVVPANKVVHGYSSVKVGWGKTILKDGKGDRAFSDNHIAILPEIGIELNITKWFRLAATGGYRIVNGLDDLPEGLDNDSFSGAFGSLTFRFGGFGYYRDNDHIDEEF
ncbi:MAG: hypothetical protein V3V14_01500 [Saprospiraceae bacterium]